MSYSEQDSLRALVAGYARHLGVDMPVPDQEGRWWFIFDGGLPVYLQRGGGNLLIIGGWAGALPHHSNDAVTMAEQLLKRNLAAARLPHCPVLSLDRRVNELTLHALFATRGATAADLALAVKYFLPWLQIWTDECRPVPNAPPRRRMHVPFNYTLP